MGSLIQFDLAKPADFLGALRQNAGSYCHTAEAHAFSPLLPDGDALSRRFTVRTFYRWRPETGGDNLWPAGTLKDMTMTGFFSAQGGKSSHRGHTMRRNTDAIRILDG